jgi:hypothetical protein
MLYLVYKDRRRVCRLRYNHPNTRLITTCPPSDRREKQSKKLFSYYYAIEKASFLELCIYVLDRLGRIRLGKRQKPSADSAAVSSSICQAAEDNLFLLQRVRQQHQCNRKSSTSAGLEHKQTV